MAKKYANNKFEWQLFGVIAVVAVAFGSIITVNLAQQQTSSQSQAARKTKITARVTSNSYTVSCNQNTYLTGTIKTNGKMTIEYYWESSTNGGVSYVALGPRKYATFSKAATIKVKQPVTSLTSGTSLAHLVAKKAGTNIGSVSNPTKVIEQGC